MILPAYRNTEGWSRRETLGLLAGTVSAPFLSSCATNGTAQRPPNIVLVLADDFGWHQLNCYGNSFYETPNIDSLAADGVRFTSAYSASPVCSPTRASLMTGKNPARLGITNYIPGQDRPFAKLTTNVITAGLPLAETTVAELLKGAGYATGHFGKWHLNKDKNYQPGRPGDPGSQGFDDVLTTKKPDPEDDPAADAHHVRLITDRAIQFINNNRDNPFFCYVTHNSIHRPQLERPDLVARYQAKPQADPVGGNNPTAGAMVETLDDSVGRILGTLDEQGLTNDTLFIFFSDNGPLYGWTERKPLYGGKGDLYEGGVRVPMIVRWPGVVSPGTENATPVISDDFFPTFADIVKRPVEDPTVDGVSILPLLSDGEAPDRDELCFHYPHYHRLTSDDGVVDHPVKPHGSIREGRFKLIEWFEESSQGSETPGAYSLYDLDADLGERENLAERMPERVTELAGRLEAWRQKVNAPRPQPNPDYDPQREHVKRDDSD